MRIWENDVNINLKVIVSKGIDWIQLAQDWVHWWAFLNTGSCRVSLILYAPFCCILYFLWNSNWTSENSKKNGSRADK
jgi:hypothetical protein